MNEFVDSCLKQIHMSNINIKESQVVDIIVDEISNSIKHAQNKTIMSRVIVIGSGPAGYTACIYLGRSNLHPVMIEGDSSCAVVPGGLLTTTKTVENFPGFPDGIDGYQLVENFKQQALNYGTQIISEVVIRIEQYTNYFIVNTNENVYKCEAIIIATGSTPKKLYVPGYDELWNKGVSTCAICDGSLPCFRNRPIAVVGGGDSACEEAEHLSRTASKIYMIHRRDKLRASSIMVERVISNPKIEMVWNSQITRIIGGTSVEAIEIDTNGKLSKIPVKGVFVAIGHVPNSEFISNLVKCDAQGYIVTKDCATSVEGIWAAGDVQDSKYRQAITAAGSGCIAAIEVERWLNA